MYIHAEEVMCVETVQATSKHSYCVETKFCPGASQTCALSLSGPYDASKGKQVGTADVTFENYVLSFTMELAGDWSITGAWQSVIHIGDENGHRMPGIWFTPNENRLYVNHDTCCGESTDTSFGFTAGSTYDIKVVLDKNKLDVYVDGVKLATSTGSSTPAREDAAVYVADPWYDAAKVTLSDICLKEIPVCDEHTADPALTVTRCTTGLEYDGTPADVFPRMLGREGVSISWLDTRYDDTSGYRVYKYDPSMPFAEDTSARLLREIPLKKADCGLTHNYLDFRDATTGSQPGLEVGYAIVPLDAAGDEVKEKVGISGVSFAPSSSGRRRRLATSSASAPSTSSGFIVTWFGDIRVKVEAEGGGPVEGVVVELGHLVHNEYDTHYPMGFLQEETDEYGEATLEVRVQDRSWFSKAQHFRVAVKKTSPKTDGGAIDHEFEPASEDVTMRHLGEFPLSFIDETSSVISGTVSHAGFDAEWFAEDCPHRTSDDDAGACMCPVDGAEMFIRRASGAEEPVTLSDGKFSKAVARGETVTLRLEQYNGTDGTVPHEFMVTHDADDATVRDGANATFTYTADEDARVDFLDASTVKLSAKVLHGADNVKAAYVNGLPVVVRVGRCGWQSWGWTLGGEATFEIGASTEVEVRTLGAEEVAEAKYYHPPDGAVGAVDDCRSTNREDMVSETDDSISISMLRGCRVEIPHGSATERRPCSTMDHTYVDELPEERIKDLDLSNKFVRPDVPTPAPVFAPSPMPTVSSAPTSVPTPVPTIYECSLSLPGIVDASAVADRTVDTLQNYELTLKMALADNWKLAAEQAIFRIGNSNAEHLPGLWINYPSGKLEVAQSSDSASGSDYWGVADVRPEFKPGETYEIKVVVESSQMTVYVNGKNVGTEWGGTYPATSAPVSVGDAAGVTLSDICLREVYVPSPAPTALPTTIAPSAVPISRPTPGPTLIATLAPARCDEGFVGDCADDDCCPASWIGDGHCDGVTQEWDCDLSCYDNDGEDCSAPTTMPTAAPIEVSFSDPQLPEPESNEVVEFWIASPLCLASVSAAAASGTTLQGLEDSTKTRNDDGYPLDEDEELLLFPPEAEEGDTVYGKACTDNWNAVFRDKDEVTFTFRVAERDPGCDPSWRQFYPWDHCSSDTDDEPRYEAQTEYDIVVRVADGVSKQEITSTTDGNGAFSFTMKAGTPNPFAPFSHELSVEFTRAFDGARISFERHVLVVGVIPEEVPQVWTAATNPTLIFSVIRDPPGGASTATLVEGSTISTSMSIEGAHAAQLAASVDFGVDVGWELDATAGACAGGLFSSKVLGIGGSAGFSYSNTPTDITVERASSRHFDVGISFSTAISTSDSPFIAGQPSDVIIGGGANLRFIKSVEVYAYRSNDDLCLKGRTTSEFLPEKITTYVTSVYEIEKLIERGAALLDTKKIDKGKNTGADAVSVDNAEIEDQIGNWQQVLKNYRQITTDNAAKSVADLLSQELEEFHVLFKKFLDEAENHGQRSKYSDFLARGLNQLAQGGIRNDASGPELPLSLKLKLLMEGEDPDAMMTDSSGHDELKSFEKNLKDRVNKAAHQCETAANFVADGDSNLCWVYHDLSQKIKLKESLLGICDLDRTNLDSGVADATSCTGFQCSVEGQLCRQGTTGAADSDWCCVSGKWEAGSCGAAPLESVENFCKKGAYRDNDNSKEIGAFGAFADTTQYLTFSGTTGLEFEWTVDESRGEDFTSTHDASVEDSIGGSFSFGGEMGRRRLSEEAMPIYAYARHAGQAGRRRLGEGIPGYAYPTTGDVHAVSKKLLEVTPEALAERRRQLITEEAEALERRRLQRERRNAVAGPQAEQEMAAAAAAAEPEAPEFGGNPCRRLDGTPLSDEERRRLGITGCIGLGGGTSSALSVSLGRAESKGTDHSHTVVVSMKDDGIVDSFAVQVSMDPVYGTPIFKTLGGRSTCPGETGTTRRDSRVTIEKITPFCGGYDIPCIGLPLGQDAFFSVVLQNLSPWETDVKYILRGAAGPSTGWDATKYTSEDYKKTGKIECDPGDGGSLEIKVVGTAGQTLRDGNGLMISPLPYGQREIRIRVSRLEFEPQCTSFKDIVLELVALCEDTDADEVADLYQYRTTGGDTGDPKVVHPVWDAASRGWADQGDGTTTAARGPDTAYGSFSVCWGDSCDLDYLLSGNDGVNSSDGAVNTSAVFAVPAALLLLVLIAAAAYMYRHHKIARVEAKQSKPTEDAAADASYDAIDVETEETNKEDQNVEKVPLRPAAGGLELSDMSSKPAAYPGGQSLPPWPYPEAKPTARPTPASYDPSCILKVSWSRDAARPTEDTLRETFQALAPVLNVGLGSGNAAMVVFKDAAGARAAEAAYDGPWRVAPAKAPAAAADQPPPPPKTGEV